MAINQKQREQVLADLELGCSLRQACRNADVQTPTAILRAMDSDPAFAEQYARAREAGYQARADELLDTARDMTIDAQSRRVICDVMRWELSKMLPKLYGDKLDLHHSGSVGKTDALSDAELRAVVDAAPTGGQKSGE